MRVVRRNIFRHLLRRQRFIPECVGLGREWGKIAVFPKYGLDAWLVIEGVAALSGGEFGIAAGGMEIMPAMARMISMGSVV